MQLSPPILTSEQTNQDAFFLFRLYNPVDNQTFKYVSLFLFITKDNKQLIAPDLYQSPNGIIRLQIQRAPGDTIIYADREPTLNGWEADYAGTIKVKGPILQEGGLYHTHIEIFGIDSFYTIFPQQKIPKFDVYLSVGDFYHKPISVNGITDNVTIISYYDKIRDMTFDGSKKTMNWSMPFNYNFSRLKSEPDVYVHEEVRIPRNFTDLTNGLFFSATADGTKVKPANLLVDPFASTSELVIHILLNKQYLEELVSQSPQINNSHGTMTFTLAPDDPSNSVTSTLLYSDRGGLAIPLTWNPDELRSGTPTLLGIAFFDQSSGRKIPGDVSYNMSIIDPKGNSILERKSLVAKGGSDSQSITFPSNQIYHIEITPSKISNSTGPIPDSTRFGKGLGVVNVPEFGGAWPLGAAGLVIGIFILTNLLLKKKNQSSS